MKLLYISPLPSVTVTLPLSLKLYSKQVQALAVKEQY